MRPVFTRIKRSFAIRGVLGTIRVCWDTASEYWSPSRRRARAMVRRRDLEFDATYGLDTRGILLPNQTEVRGDNWIFGSRYQGIDPAGFVQVLSELSIDHERFTFIDFGSGKGRAIFLAMSFQFKKIIGIEYSEQMNLIARRNLFRYPSSAKRCKEIELVCGDATELQIPDGPLVLYFYNPFGRPVMEKVIHNVSTSFRLYPRRIVVIYFGPEHMDLWDKAGFLSRTRASDWIAMYDTYKEGLLRHRIQETGSDP
jgi:SAM-dependent methyltransferase